MLSTQNTELAPRIWQVGALCRAVADTLDARFNPVAVRGEISGFSRASSGHCYFSIKDSQGQLRCAMFRRAASLLGFEPRDGELVELRGRLAVYEPRGDLQLIVESIQRAGQGALFEEFLRLKAKLEGLGLFKPERKRALPVMPRGIGLVTSLGAAALHDVATALRRRVPHIPVVLAPAAVQGAGAAPEIIRSLSALFEQSQVSIDLVLLVRGGGSMEDLWAFNNEQLAMALAACPVPVVVGVGHETDFTIADFVADLRAPTPTAAAELVGQPRDTWMAALQGQAGRLQDAIYRQVDQQSQRLDLMASRLGRPSSLVAMEQVRLSRWGLRLSHGARTDLARQQQAAVRFAERLDRALKQRMSDASQRLGRSEMRLELLDPHLVLQRGYAWLSDSEGKPVSSTSSTYPGQVLQATLADGQVDLTVSQRRLI
jgi:exodeoxyribonuclease VII large subunit